MTESFTFFVGVDLGAERHHVVVLNAAGETVGRRSVEHNGADVLELFSWLANVTANALTSLIAIAAETPRGSIVESGLERGHPVFSINPKQLDRFRDRFSVAGAKDDYRDARVLAASLRTDQHCFRGLQLGDPRLVLLRELSRTADLLQRDLRRNCNQLWSLLQRYFPALLSLSPAADDPWLWTLLQSAPLPAQAAGLKPRQLEKILAAHHIRRFCASELADLLRQPPLPMAPGAAEALAESAVLLLPHLSLLHQQIAQLASRIDKIIDQLQQDPSFAEHRDIEILRTFPGSGRVFTATVLAEAHQPLVERDYHAMRALGGAAPVTRQSGKTELIMLRRAYNHRVQHALFHSANVFVQKDPRARQQYHRLRQKGNTHARALRGVADRMLALLFTLLKNGSCYDSDRRQVPNQTEGTPPQKNS
jgi:transposase